MEHTTEGGQSDMVGQIAQEFGATEIRTLRSIYGQAFAVGLPEHMELSELVARMEERGLWQVRQHYEDGSLARRIREAGG
jgi:hypothetical protein